LSGKHDLDRDVDLTTGRRTVLVTGLGLGPASYLAAGDRVIVTDRPAREREAFARLYARGLCDRVGGF
jgi:hypothetical protein